MRGLSGAGWGWDRGLGSDSDAGMRRPGAVFGDGARDQGRGSEGVTGRGSQGGGQRAGDGIRE
ncbi:hypothetical protein GCM10009834_04140 [Streptomonospora arabica]